jgi:hypothetical protein
LFIQQSCLANGQYSSSSFGGNETYALCYWNMLVFPQVVMDTIANRYEQRQRNQTRLDETEGQLGSWVKRLPTILPYNQEMQLLL